MDHPPKGLAYPLVMTNITMERKNDPPFYSWLINQQKHKLVGGLKQEFYLPFHIWDVILPID